MVIYDHTGSTCCADATGSPPNEQQLLSGLVVLSASLDSEGTTMGLGVRRVNRLGCQVENWPAGRCGSLLTVKRPWVSGKSASLIRRQAAANR